MKTIRYFFVLPLALLFFGVQWAGAQNSHLGNLIDVYKEQNGNRPVRSSRSGTPSPEMMQAMQAMQAGQQQPMPTPQPMPQQLPYGMPMQAVPQPMPNGVPPQSGLIRDPHAGPDDLLNQPPAEQILLASANPPRSGLPPEMIPLGGNPRDPLGADFMPYLKPSAERHVTPYDEMVYDARLNDVCFVDANRGWAVGDRGAIWHTENGGTSWQLQETPIDCTLRSVSFLDGAFGLAVGGYSFPFTAKGRGVVLGTRDGGKTWTVLQTPDYPTLHYVKIHDSLKVHLAGESSERYPTGLYLSVDGARTWKPISDGKNHGWISIDMVDEKNGVGIDAGGKLRRIGDSTATVATASFGTSKLAEIKLVAGADPPGKINGWMVGSGGLVLSTQDRGARWGVVPGKLPGNSAMMVDLETVECRGTNLWVAGSPGTYVYSSADLGKTWKATPTGIASTLRKIVFADDKTGWAVGELGTILKTVDGGNSWTPQRRGGTRLAVLGVFARAGEIPLEAFAALCANQGYLGGATLVFREPEQGDVKLESPWTHRVHEALVRSGAVGLWELGPFRLERSEILKDYNHLVDVLQKENDGKGMDRIRERLVAAIRQWKPEIVLTAEVGRSKDPARELVLREVMEAVKIAGDPAVFPYQLTELGLEPWKVKKVHVALEDNRPGDVNLTVTEPSVRLGQSLDDLAFVSRGLLKTSDVPRPETDAALLGFLTPYDLLEPTRSKDFFAGIEIVPGSEARRNLIGSYVDRWEDIRQRIQLRRHTLGIIRKVGQAAEQNGRPASDVRLASNAAELARKIDGDAAVRMLLELGRKYHHEGDWESACEAYEIVARQYSRHPLARHAFLWLLQYQGGEEPAWRKHAQNTVLDSRTTLNEDRTATISAQGGASLDRQKLDPRLDKAVALGKFLSENFADLAAEAPIRFSLASAQRRKGDLPDAVKFYRSRGRIAFDDVWGMRARTEYWLALDDKSELPEEQRELPMPAIVCAYTGAKPLLDGHFDRNPRGDGGVWYRSSLYSLTPEKPRQRLNEMMKGKAGDLIGAEREKAARAASKNFGTRVMFLYDQDYLYFAVRCPKAAGFSYPPIAEKPRARDVPVDDQDRVEILLDVDRDYGTAYSLTIDSRSWVVDACWGDKTWNPELRIARHEDRDAWYVEAALALNSLTDRYPYSGTVWNVGLRRIVPGAGIECWNAENSFDLTEAFGPLLFE